LGGAALGSQERWKFLEQFLYLGWESSRLQGLTKELVLALVKVWPEAACRTCCFAGIIENSNFARKGVVTAARKKSNSKLWPAKQMVWRRRPQAGFGLPLDLWAAPSLNAAELK
jgi:hypothetical protein